MFYHILSAKSTISVQSILMEKELEGDSSFNGLEAMRQSSPIKRCSLVWALEGKPYNLRRKDRRNSKGGALPKNLFV